MRYMYVIYLFIFLFASLLRERRQFPRTLLICGKYDKDASRAGPRQFQLGRSFYPVDGSLLSLPTLRQHGNPPKTSTHTSETVRSVSQ